MNKINRVWLYCRVGSSSQAVDILNAERNVLLAYSQKMGFEVTGISVDIGSGLDYNRSGFNEVIQAACNRQMDFLLTRNIDRIGRDSHKTLDFVRGLTQLGIKLHTVHDGEFDYDKLICKGLRETIKGGLI